LELNSGGSIVIRRNFTISGATTISGTIRFGSSSATTRTINFTGAVTLNSGAIWDETNSGTSTVTDTYNFASDFTNNATTFTALTGSPHNFTGTTKTISGSTVTTMPTATFTGTYTNSGLLTCATILTVTTNTLTNNGTITATTALSGTGGITQGTTGILNIGGTSGITTMTATAAGNSVNYTGAAQTIHTGNYSNLNLSGSGAKTLVTGTTSIGNLTTSGTITTTTVVGLTITGNLTIGSGTTFTTGTTFTLGVTGATSVSGSLVLGGTGTKTFTGDITLNTGAVWNESGVATIAIAGNLTNNATTFTANTGAHNFTGATKIISGSTTTSIPTSTFTGSYTFNSPYTSATLLTVTGAAVSITNNSTLTATTSLAGTGSVIQGASGVLNIGGTSTITTINASAAGNTVNYTGAAQTAKVTTYSNLTLSGSGLKTFATAPTVNAVLSMEGTATISIAPTYGASAALQYNTATARTTGVEWITTFIATGGIIIKNTGVITLQNNKQIGNNTNVPLNINAGATLTRSTFTLTLQGDFVNNGTTTGSGGVTISGTVSNQSIDDFVTTGTVSFTKTAGTAIFTGNVSGAALTINGSGATLNLGVGLTHTFTGIITLTAGTLNGGSSTLNENAVSTTAWNGTGSVFVAANSTINFGAAGNQTIAANSTFNNLSLSGSGTKTFSNATTIGNNLSISGTAVANLGTGLTHSSVSLTLGGASQVIGTWGGSASSATNKNTTYFGSTATGTINVSCVAPSAPTSSGNVTICSGATIPALSVSVSGGQSADWYNQSSGGTLLSTGTTSYTPAGAGTYYAETRTVVTGCLSATRTAVVLTVNSLPVALSLTGSTICASPGGNGTISSTTSVVGVNYQLYNSSNSTVQTAKAGTGSALVWTSLAAGNGYYVVSSNATTGCTISSATVDVTTNANPTNLVLSASPICDSPGGNGVITSTTSQSGINYQLYDSGNIAVQTIEPGTGSSVSWTDLNAASGYYVVGTNTTTGCTTTSSSVSITTTPNPIALVLSGSTICALPGDNGTVVSTTSQIGVDYILNDNLGNDIDILPGSGSAITYTGLPVGTGYYVEGVNATTGCTSVTSNSVNVASSPNPSDKTITVSASSVCIGTGTNLIVAGSLAAETYQIRNNANDSNIGTAVTGNGSNVSLSTGVLSIATTFNVLAVNTATGCSTVLTTTPLVSIISNNTVSAASSSPTLCINTVLTAITHTTTGAIGIGTATGLPAGVSASWSSNTITISGTPSSVGTFNYSIPLSGGCGTVNATGTIVVTPSNTASAASSSPTLCINSALTTITHSTTGATGIGTATGLPTGVSASWSSNTITISGTPTLAGTFNYSIPLTGGCSSVSATGTIIVTASNTVSAASSSPTVCINSAMTTITHTTTGATGIGTATGLPTGVSASWSSNTITISGTPTLAGTFNYSIPLTGGCSSVNATGTIIVTASNTVSAASSSPTACINSAITSITHTTTGATGIGTATGLPTGVSASWSSNTITISGSPSSAGTFNYSIPLTGGCSSVNATGTITVDAAAVGGTISGPSHACLGNSSGLLTLTGNLGTVVRWEYAVSPYTTWNSISNTATTYTSGALTESTAFRAVVQNGLCSEVYSSPITLTINVTTWASGAWSNGAPTSTTSAVITSSYLSGGTSIDACSLVVSNNASVVISSGDSMTLLGSLNVGTGSLVTFNNNANLIQGGLTNTNTGSIQFKRNSSALKRQDYTLWSSPVANQKLLPFSSLTLTNRFYTYNTSTNLYDVVASPSTTNFDTAKGYLIRMPNNHPTTATVWSGTFTGVPNNGNYTYNLDNNGAGMRFNLVGNPYPSPIDASSFILNSVNANTITGALYFWRKTNNALSPSYCTWTLGGFVSNGEAQVNDPNDVIQAGQGFFVEATGVGSTVVFDNTMRINNHANQFFKSSTGNEKNRVWLNLTSSTGLFSQTMIGYMTNATQGVDTLIDGKYINDGEIALTSIIEGTPYAIQGRALPFDVNDIVPLSVKVTNAGDYSIAISHVDGFFVANQNVYIRDNYTGIIHDLNQGMFTFSSESGTFNDRFEVLYQLPLGYTNPTFTANQVVIYKNTKGDFEVNSGSSLMSTLRVYDISGRQLLEKNNINDTRTTFSTGLANEVYLVQIISDSGIKVNRKIVN
jgi:hypothetical protein